MFLLNNSMNIHRRTLKLSAMSNFSPWYRKCSSIKCFASYMYCRTLHCKSLSFFIQNWWGFAMVSMGRKTIHWDCRWGQPDWSQWIQTSTWCQEGKPNEPSWGGWVSPFWGPTGALGLDKIIDVLKFEPRNFCLRFESRIYLDCLKFESRTPRQPSRILKFTFTIPVCFFEK